MSYPEGVVLHIPHNSTEVPPTIRGQFVLTDEDLHRELIKMTDHWTYYLFAGPAPDCAVVVAPVSRLVVDVERFNDDALEVMATVGMGAVYQRTSNGVRLRRELMPSERASLIQEYYRTHHDKLTQSVDANLLAHTRCLIIDAHSFPSVALPYEMGQNLGRPQICIGADEVHTPRFVISTFVESFLGAGFTVAVNRPFSGAIVPQKHYRANPKVLSVMIEVNRGLYLDESTGELREDSDGVIKLIRTSCQSAAKQVLNGRQESHNVP